MKFNFAKSGFVNTNSRSITRLQRITDLIVLGVAFNVYQPQTNWTTDFINIPTEYIVCIIVLIVLPNSGIYRSYRHKSLNQMFGKINSTWIMIVCLVILTMFLNKSSTSYSRVAILMWSITGWSWLILTNILTRMYLRKMRKNGLNSRTILYWGRKQSVIKFSSQLSMNPWLGYRVIAWFSPEDEDDCKSLNLPYFGGGIKELKVWLDKNTVDCIVFSEILDREFNENNSNLIRIFGNTCSRVLYAPDWCFNTMKFESETIGSYNCIEVWGARQAYDEIIIKRIFDFVLALMGTIIILPVLITISIAVKISSKGPILYVQKRCGLNGRVFKCYKFRSMYVNHKEEDGILTQATKDDKRITLIGKYLRRWSLDELPQLINVIEGSMSLVGPRPHALEHDKLYRSLVTGYSQRHVYKPGMTGLAQVRGYRGEIKEISAMEARVNADLEYQKNWSILTDIEILCRTFITVIKSDAY